MTKEEILEKLFPIRIRLSIATRQTTNKEALKSLDLVNDLIEEMVEDIANVQAQT